MLFRAAAWLKSVIPLNVNPKFNEIGTALFGELWNQFPPELQPSEGELFDVAVALGDPTVGKIIDSTREQPLISKEQAVLLAATWITRCSVDKHISPVAAGCLILELASVIRDFRDIDSSMLSELLQEIDEEINFNHTLYYDRYGKEPEGSVADPKELLKSYQVFLKKLP